MFLRRFLLYNVPCFCSKLARETPRSNILLSLTNFIIFAQVLGLLVGPVLENSNLLMRSFLTINVSATLPFFYSRSSSFAVDNSLFIFYGLCGFTIVHFLFTIVLITTHLGLMAPRLVQINSIIVAIVAGPINIPIVLILATQLSCLLRFGDLLAAGDPYLVCSVVYSSRPHIVVPLAIGAIALTCHFALAFFTGCAHGGSHVATSSWPNASHSWWVRCATTIWWMAFAALVTLFEGEVVLLSGIAVLGSSTMALMHVTVLPLNIPEVNTAVCAISSALAIISPYRAVAALLTVAPSLLTGYTASSLVAGAMVGAIAATVRLHGVYSRLKPLLSAAHHELLLAQAKRYPLHLAVPSGEAMLFSSASELPLDYFIKRLQRLSPESIRYTPFERDVDAMTACWPLMQILLYRRDAERGRGWVGGPTSHSFTANPAEYSAFAPKRTLMMPLFAVAPRLILMVFRPTLLPSHPSVLLASSLSNGALLATVHWVITESLAAHPTSLPLQLYLQHLHRTFLPIDPPSAIRALEDLRHARHSRTVPAPRLFRPMAVPFLLRPAVIYYEHAIIVTAAAETAIAIGGDDVASGVAAYWGDGDVFDDARHAHARCIMVLDQLHAIARDVAPDTALEDSDRILDLITEFSSQFKRTRAAYRLAVRAQPHSTDVLGCYAYFKEGLTSLAADRCYRDLMLRFSDNKVGRAAPRSFKSRVQYLMGLNPRTNDSIVSRFVRRPRTVMSQLIVIIVVISIIFHASLFISRPIDLPEMVDQLHRTADNLARGILLLPATDQPNVDHIQAFDFAALRFIQIDGVADVLFPRHGRWALPVDVTEHCASVNPTPATATTCLTALASIPINLPPVTPGPIVALVGLGCVAALIIFLIFEAAGNASQFVWLERRVAVGVSHLWASSTGGAEPVPRTQSDILAAGREIVAKVQQWLRANTDTPTARLKSSFHPKIRGGRARRITPATIDKLLLRHIAAHGMVSVASIDPDAARTMAKAERKDVAPGAFGSQRSLLERAAPNQKRTLTVMSALLPLTAIGIVVFVTLLSVSSSADFMATDASDTRQACIELSSGVASELSGLHDAARNITLATAAVKGYIADLEADPSSCVEWRAVPPLTAIEMVRMHHTTHMPQAISKLVGACATLHIAFTMAAVDQTAFLQAVAPYTCPPSVPHPHPPAQPALAAQAPLNPRLSALTDVIEARTVTHAALASVDPTLPALAARATLVDAAMVACIGRSAVESAAMAMRGIDDHVEVATKEFISAIRTRAVLLAFAGVLTAILGVLVLLTAFVNIAFVSHVLPFIFTVTVCAVVSIAFFVLSVTVAADSFRVSDYFASDFSPAVSAVLSATITGLYSAMHTLTGSPVYKWAFLDHVSHPAAPSPFDILQADVGLGLADPITLPHATLTLTVPTPGRQTLADIVQGPWSAAAQRDVYARYPALAWATNLPYMVRADVDAPHSGFHLSDMSAELYTDLLTPLCSVRLDGEAAPLEAWMFLAVLCLVPTICLTVIHPVVAEMVVPQQAASTVYKVVLLRLRFAGHYLWHFFNLHRKRRAGLARSHVARLVIAGLALLLTFMSAAAVSFVIHYMAKDVAVEAQADLAEMIALTQGVAALAEFIDTDDPARIMYVRDVARHALDLDGGFLSSCQPASDIVAELLLFTFSPEPDLTETFLIDIATLYTAIIDDCDMVPAIARGRMATFSSIVTFGLLTPLFILHLGVTGWFLWRCWALLELLRHERRMTHQVIDMDEVR